MKFKTLSFALVLGALAIASDGCPAACDIPHDPSQLTLNSGSDVRLDALRARLEKAGYTVRELRPEEMGPIVSLDGSEVRALGIEKGGRECHIYYFTNPGDTHCRLGPFWDSSQGPASVDQWRHKLILPL